MDRLHLFFAANYLAQGLSGVVYEPLSYLLKDGLRLSPGQSAGFVALMTMPFLFKPLFGLMSDLLPLGGLRRRPHLMLASGVAASAWIILASKTSLSYGSLLALLVLVNVGICAADAICDAVMVEQGRESHKTGLYQAIQIGTLYAAIVVTGLGGGWLAAHASPRLIFALAALFPSMILFSSLLVRERPVKSTRSMTLQGLRGLLGEKRFWALTAVIFLWSFAPFLGTAQFYYQSESLKLGPQYIGFLATLGGLAGVLGAAFFGRVVGKAWDTATMSKAAVWLGAPLSLAYLLYLGPVSAAIVTVLTGFAGVVFRLALMDLAAQSCPDYGEAAAFAAYMSVFNLAASASNAAGGMLYERLGALFAGAANPSYLAVAVLAALGSLCTLACWPLLSHAGARSTASGRS